MSSDPLEAVARFFFPYDFDAAMERRRQHPAEISGDLDYAFKKARLAVAAYEAAKPAPAAVGQEVVIERCAQIIDGFDGERFTPQPGLFEGLTPLQIYRLGIDDCSMWAANDVRALLNGGANG